MARVSSGPEIVVVGSLNLDLTVGVERHPRPGETVLGEDVVRTPGGKGANQAVAAARLGRRVAMVGRLGEDADGAALRAALDADGVDLGHVSELPDAPTGVALITVDPRGENVIVVSPGANARLDAAGVEEAGPELGAARVCLLQLEVPLEVVARAAELASGTVVLNPAPARELPDALMRAVDVLVPNRGELALLAGAEEEPEALADVAALARAIEWPETIVVTLGAEGALLVTAGGEVHVPAVPVRPVDTTAAGDCFCGALGDALARGEDLEAAARWAVRAAAVATTRPGAQASLPTREEVEGGAAPAG
jgi:ribokinase